MTFKPIEDFAVHDVMTAPVVACRDEAFFEEIAEILADRDISGMPVVDGEGRVVGVISERDLAYAFGGPMVRLAIRRHSDLPMHVIGDLPAGARRARDIMTSPAVTVSLDTRLEEVARLMHNYQINRIPIMDGDHLVGIVTRGDVLGAVAHEEQRTIDLTKPPMLIGAGAVPARPSIHL